MPGKYYYLVASLPYLSIEKPLPITCGDFISECKKWLTIAELALLARAHLTQIEPNGKGVLAGWETFINNFNKQLTMARQAQKQARKYVMPDLLKEVFEQKNPLLMEKKIAKIKWQYLDLLEPEYHFDINLLVIYFLKLQILERLAVFNKQQGKIVFKKLHAADY